MIKLLDAGVLALTKLRTRKIRTIITIVMASTLFSTLVASSLIMTGAFESEANFSKDGLSNRYIVSVDAPPNLTFMSDLNKDPNTIIKAKAQYEDLVERKTKRAKELGAVYSRLFEPLPYTERPDGTETLSYTGQNPIVQDIMQEKINSTPGFDEAKLQRITKQYGAKDFMNGAIYMTSRGASLQVLDDGKETFSDTSEQQSYDPRTYTPPLLDNVFTMFPQQLAESFLLPNNAGWTPDSHMLPIIMPQDKIERLLGMKALADSATPQQKLDRLKQARQQAQNITFVVCYRNSASSAQISQVLQQQKEKTAREKDKDKASKTYVEPALQYGLPDPGACANATVISDTRTAMEKEQTENQRLFEKEFGADTDPVSRMITFKVVGISPDAEHSNQSSSIRSLGDVVNQLFQPYGIGQAIPMSLYDKAVDKALYDSIIGPEYLPLWLGVNDQTMRFVEFSSAAGAEKFIDEQSCKTEVDGKCHPLGRPYMASLSFSNSAAISDIRHKANQLFQYAIIGVITLAALMMWVAISRTIADGRRETAVFRAIGFKRLDISIVYITYTFMLSVLVAVVAAGAGYAVAWFVNNQFGPQLTVQAQYSFGALDLSKQITLIGFDTVQLGIIFAACLLTGILSVILPLMRNVRRNPINDMRDEQ